MTSAAAITSLANQVPYSVQIALVLFVMFAVVGAGLRAGMLAMDWVLLEAPVLAFRWARRTWDSRPRRCSYCGWPSSASGWARGRPTQWSHRDCRIRATSPPGGRR